MSVWCKGRGQSKALIDALRPVKEAPQTKVILHHLDIRLGSIRANEAEVLRRVLQVCSACALALRWSVLAQATLAPQPSCNSDLTRAPGRRNPPTPEPLRLRVEARGSAGELCCPRTGGVGSGAGWWLVADGSALGEQVLAAGLSACTVPIPILPSYAPATRPPVLRWRMLLPGVAAPFAFSQQRARRRRCARRYGPTRSIGDAPY